MQHEARRAEDLIPFQPDNGQRDAIAIGVAFQTSPPLFHGFRKRCTRWPVFSRVKCRFLKNFLILGGVLHPAVQDVA